jgi:hypothetical protein
MLDKADLPGRSGLEAECMSLPSERFRWARRNGPLARESSYFEHVAICNEGCSWPLREAPFNTTPYGRGSLFNITEAPTAMWTAQLVINAFPDETAPAYLLRDRDSIYGSDFVRRVKDMGIQQKLVSPRSPWQSPYVECLVGSIRRKCLDRAIVFNERRLRQIVKSYFQYYLEVRPHRSLVHDSPVPRPVQALDCGKVIEMPLVGGLHHHYLCQAA